MEGTCIFLGSFDTEDYNYLKAILVSEIHSLRISVKMRQLIINLQILLSNLFLSHQYRDLSNSKYINLYFTHLCKFAEMH